MEKYADVHAVAALLVVPRARGAVNAVVVTLSRVRKLSHLPPRRMRGGTHSRSVLRRLKRSDNEQGSDRVSNVQAVKLIINKMMVICRLYPEDLDFQIQVFFTILLFEDFFSLIVRSISNYFA